MWSPASRRRLLKVAGSVNWEDLTSEWGGDWIFVTLTYRDDPGAQRAKRDLDVLARRWARRWGACRWLWKMEFQRRGVVHFHVQGWVPWVRPAPLADYRHWLWRTWTEIAGDGQRLRVDADYSEARDLVRYFVAYARSPQKAYQHIVPAAWSESSGRWWGLRDVPVLWREFDLGPREFVRVRRILLRYRRSRSRGRIRSQARLAGCWALGQRSGSLARDVLTLLEDP